MGTQKVTLFKALMHVGYRRVAPRTLSRGNNLVQLKFSSGEGKWYVNTPFGGGAYSSSRDALHALVLRFALDKNDLKKMIDFGLSYAQDEFNKYDDTISRIERESKRAIMNFLKEEKKNPDNIVNKTKLSKIVREFKKQVIFSRLDRELELNNNTCPVCGREYFTSTSLYNHISRTSFMRESHKNFLVSIMNEITGLTP